MSALIVISLASIVAYTAFRRYAPRYARVFALYSSGAYVLPIASSLALFGHDLRTLVLQLATASFLSSLTGFFLVVLVVEVGRDQWFKPTKRFSAFQPRFMEDEGEPSWPFLVALLAVSVVAGLASVWLLRAVSSSGIQGTSLYQLNVDFARFSESIGPIGRLARLGMPVGLFALIKGTRATSGRRRWALLAIAVISTSSLLSVRRAAFLDALAFIFGAVVLGAVTMRQRRTAMVSATAIAVLGLAFFGFVQVSTRKSLSVDVVESAILDSAVYLAGNLPYANCMASSASTFPAGISFPAVGYAVSAITRSPRPDYAKPFCVIGSLLVAKQYKRVRFNTSPAYFDIWVDFGYVGVILSYAALGALLAALAGASKSSLGLMSMAVMAAILTFRENLFGQYDFAFAIMVYLALLTFDWLDGSKRKTRSQGGR